MTQTSFHIYMLFALLASNSNNNFCFGYEYPANEYEYSIRRDELVDLEKKFAGTDGSFTQDEMIVNGYLQYFKWREFQETKDKDFAPARPIEDMLDNIVNSELYRVLKTLPKGGNMHTHESHQLDKRTLLEIVWNSTDFKHLYIINPANSSERDQGTLDFFINPPADKDWLNVKDHGYTIDEVLQYHTLINLLDEYAKNRPTDSGARWKLIDPLWVRGSTQLIANINIKSRYIEEMILQGLAEGVQYIESRKSLGSWDRVYELDPNANDTNGKKYLDVNGEKDIAISIDAIESAKQSNPEFIGMRRIIYSSRRSSKDYIKEDMERVFQFMQQYPEHIVGYDMVGDEDRGNALLEHLSNFLELYDEDTGLSKMPLFLHTAETSWAEDLISSINDHDMVATIQNVYEAVLLGARRVGHGLGFLKHPYLVEQLKQRKIAVEVCIVSNQILALLADTRNHPAVNFYRYGVPIVLGADDPGTFGYDSFTVDWYQAYLGWGLDLMDLKHIARNSLTYSSLTGSELNEAFHKWESSWDDYITSMKQEACAAELSAYNPHFANIVPHSGAKNDQTNVHIYGRNFERAVCVDGTNGLRCRFGERDSTREQYIANHHVICEAPPQPEGTIAQVHISLDGGATYTYLNQNFTYIHDRISRSTTEPTILSQRSTEPVSGSPFIYSDCKLIFTCVLVFIARINLL